jgi:hypothetical protein
MLRHYYPRGAVPVVPNDAGQGQTFVGLYVGGGGNLTTVDELGYTTTHYFVPAGSFIRLRVAKVMATGTTCTDIVGYLA